MSASFTNQDVMRMQAFPEYDLLWSDPPWGQSMVQYFERLMAHPPANEIEKLLVHIARLHHPGKPAFIEYSCRGYDVVRSAFSAAGHSLKNITQAIQQASGRPFVILAFNTRLVIPEGLKGTVNIEYAINSLKPGTVFDPCAGIGVTAKAVLGCGVNYVGNELVPARFKRLQRLSAAPEPVPA